MKLILILSSFFFVALAILIGCTNDPISSVKPVDECAHNEATISFKIHIKPVFHSKCALPDCHTGKSPKGNLNLDSTVVYAMISKKGKGYIDTINPKNGVLYSSLVSTSQPMPPAGKLDDCTLSIIEQWMKQGAKNN